MKKKKRRFFNLNINLKIILKKHILRKDINLKKKLEKKEEGKDQVLSQRRLCVWACNFQQK